MSAYQTKSPVFLTVANSLKGAGVSTDIRQPVHLLPKVVLSRVLQQKKLQVEARSDSGSLESKRPSSSEDKSKLDASSFDQLDQLSVFEEVLDEIEAEKQTQLSEESSILQDTQLKKPGLDLPPLDQSPVSSMKKEAEISTGSAVEQAAGAQLVEQEPSPELSPEVEKYLKEVHEDKDQAPKEIAIADEIANLPTQNQFVSEPVIVVPITPEIEKRGKRKSYKFSIRWLVEWSQKIIKMFAGKVIYLQPTEDK